MECFGGRVLQVVVQFYDLGFVFSGLHLCPSGGCICGSTGLFIFYFYFLYIYIFQFLCTCVFCKLYLFVASEGREILVACATVVIFLAYEFHSPRILSIVGNYINPIKSIMAEFFIYKSFLCSCLHFFQAYF